ATATWFLTTVSTRVQRRFRDRVTIALESHVARLQASVVTITHHERPDYLDRLSVLRNQIFVLDHMYMSVFSTAGWILRLAVPVWRLTGARTGSAGTARWPRRAGARPSGTRSGGRSSARGSWARWSSSRRACTPPPPTSSSCSPPGRVSPRTSEPPSVRSGF